MEKMILPSLINRHIGKFYYRFQLNLLRFYGTEVTMALSVIHVDVNIKIREWFTTRYWKLSAKK